MERGQHCQSNGPVPAAVGLGPEARLLGRSTGKVLDSCRLREWMQKPHDPRREEWVLCHMDKVILGHGDAL